MSIAFVPVTDPSAPKLRATAVIGDRFRTGRAVYRAVERSKHLDLVQIITPSEALYERCERVLHGREHDSPDPPFLSRAMAAVTMVPLNAIVSSLLPTLSVSDEDLFKGAAVRPSVVDDLNAPQVVDSVRKHEADVVIFGGTPQILKEAWQHGAWRYLLNVHPSPLPRQRGSCPIWWSIVDGEEHKGVTVHRLEPGVDDGPMLAQLVEPLTEQTTGGQLLDWILEKIPLVLDEAVERIRTSTEELRPQDESRATIRRWPRKIHRRIHWRVDGTDMIVRKARAGQAPYPLQPFFTMRGRPIELGSAEAVNPRRYFTNGLAPQPGMVLAWSTDWLDIATIDGAVRLSDLSLFGWTVPCDRLALSIGEFAT